MVMVMNDLLPLHPLCAMSICPPILRYSYFKIWPRKSMVKVMCVVKGQGHVWPSKFKGQGYMVKVKPIGYIWGLKLNWYVCFSFRGNRTTFDWDTGNSIFDLENSRSGWPRSNLMVTSEALSSIVMAKVKADGHIWSLKFHRSVCFSFRGNWTIFGWDIANSIFDLEKSRSRSQRKSTKI